MRTDHGGAPHARIDASVNVNPLGPPDSLDAVFERGRELASRYPDIHAAPAKAAWASRLAVPEREVLVGNGASELLSLVVRAYAPRRVHVFEPTYSEYAAAARAAGAQVEPAELVRDGDAWRTPLETMTPEAGDVVVVCTPNNPTGHLVPPGDVLMCAHYHPKSLVIVDESFLGFAEHAEALSLLGDADLPPNVAVVRSLTKLYCVPGLRLGIARVSADLADRIGEIRDPWAVNALAIEAGVTLAAEDDPADAESYVGRTVAWCTAERARVTRELRAIPGLTACDSDGPFVLCRLPAPLATADLVPALAERSIAVRDASTFAGLGPDWFRVGLRSIAENDEVLDAIRAFVASAR